MPSKADGITEALRRFDLLPNSAQVRLPVVLGLFGVSHSTIWRRVRTGTLPKPRKFGERTTTWNVGELREVLASKQAA